MENAGTTSSHHIRPVDTNRDLTEIADLIEVCFAATMDEDGRDYIRHIRRAAQDSSLRVWAAGPNERISMPISGYVWEENGRIIGNLSLIPYYRQGGWRTMIANVAVHPDHRRRGMGRTLTVKGLEHIRDHGVREAWLQVRDDNPIAQALYFSLGFKERCRRTTWDLDQAEPSMPSLALVEVSSRQAGEWETQKGWLKRIYTQEVAWNLGFDASRLEPGLLKSFSRWMEGHTQAHWRARKLGDLLGFITWEAPSHTQGTVWLAPNPECEPEAVEALLAMARQYVPTRRPISLNYPAGQAVEAFTRAGFTPLNTLVWMSMELG